MYEEILFVVSAMRQLVNQLRIAVERKDYRFVFGEQRIKLRVGQSVRVQHVRLQLH